MTGSTAFHTLILPGWQDSDPQHWQSRWEQRYGYQRVQQHDWMRPLRGDWMMRLDETLLTLPADCSVRLVAHSLGCLLVAAWASHSRLCARVQCAFLVAPADVEREDLRTVLPSWSPIPRARLPFASLVLASSDDPYSSQARSAALAANWGARFVDAGPLGHINTDSMIGDWPDGHARFTDFSDNNAAPA